jgi:GT2 family glycosyltransferase
MNERPLVDVVILTWNDGAELMCAVRSALASDGVDVRVWVIDNGSEPAAEVERDPRISLFRSPTNLGVAPGRALGVALGTATYVCLLDSDARLESTCLARLVAVTSQEGTGLAVPVFLGQYPEASAGRAPTAVRKLARGLGLTASYASSRDVVQDGSWDVDFGIGACQVMRRSVYEAVGGLDTSIFYGPEDVDLCLRIGRAGWSVKQVADARCHHPARRRNRSLLTRRGLRHGSAVVRHLWKHRRTSSRQVSAGC